MTNSKITLADATDGTLVYLVKKVDGKISEICLSMKKRGFGEGKWNGAGGKVELNESIEEGAIRETKEEIGVEVLKLDKVARIKFDFINNPDWNLTAHAFFSDEWEGAVLESDEMKPVWFKVDDIPYNDMWLADKIWLPMVLEGNMIVGEVDFEDSDTIARKEFNSVENL